jgi:transcriptional regulator with XRE-family HTH domain
MVKLKIRQICKERGISMGKLSRGADIDYTTVTRLFQDKNYSPTLETLNKVAVYLSLTIDELIEK